MPVEKIMERSGGPKEATDVWVIRFWNFKTVYCLVSYSLENNEIIPSLIFPKFHSAWIKGFHWSFINSTDNTHHFFVSTLSRFLQSDCKEKIANCLVIINIICIDPQQSAAAINNLKLRTYVEVILLSLEFCRGVNLGCTNFLNGHLDHVHPFYNLAVPRK